MASAVVRSCRNCHKAQSELSKPLDRCVRCEVINYCGKECQRQDWSRHKILCGPSPSDPQAIATNLLRDHYSADGMTLTFDKDAVGPPPCLTMQGRNT
jgi:MYND finger